VDLDHMLLIMGLSEFQWTERNGRSRSKSRRRLQLLEYTRAWSVCAIESAAHAPEIALSPL
jgi:hypothetical protein